MQVVIQLMPSLQVEQRIPQMVLITGSWDGHKSVTISGNAGFRMLSAPVSMVRIQIYLVNFGLKA